MQVNSVPRLYNFHFTSPTHKNRPSSPSYTNLSKFVGQNDKKALDIVSSPREKNSGKMNLGS
jgi:hypothetical protein